jgi:hypothetical protein
MMLFLDTPQDPVLLDFILDFFEGAVVGAGG